MKILVAAGIWLRTPYAAVAAFVLLGLITALGFYRLETTQADLEQATEERAQLLAQITEASCDGAKDVRGVVIDLVEFTGENQLNADDYTGELRDVIIESQARGQRFRDDVIGKLGLPPPQCNRASGASGAPEN